MKAFVVRFAAAGAAALLVTALALPAHADHQQRGGPSGCAVGGGYGGGHGAYRGGHGGYGGGQAGHGGHRHGGNAGHGGHSGHQHGGHQHGGSHFSHGQSHFGHAPSYGYRPQSYGSPGGLGIYLPRLGLQFRF